jgi:hypothetical protein
MTYTRRLVRLGLSAGVVYAAIVGVQVARQPSDPQEIFPFYTWALFSRVPGPEVTGYGVRLIEVDGTRFDPPLPIELAEGRALHTPTIETQIQELGAAIEEGRPLVVERLRRRFEESALRGRDATYVVTWRRWDVRDRFTCRCDIEWRELARWETRS